MDTLDYIIDDRLILRSSKIALNALAKLSHNPLTDALIKNLSEFDESTYIHSYNVAKLSVVIGTCLDIDKNELYELAISAIFHDVGKIEVGIDIINKKGKLTSDEFREVKRHPLIGCRNIKELGFSRNILRGVLEHQEKWSGEGYPSGKRGNQISLFGRILAIADVFDALTSERPYHNAMTPKEAISYMWSTNDFDRQILKKFIEIVNLENQMVV